MKVAITGMGIVSSIGQNVDENHRALQNVEPGISVIENVQTRHQHDIKVGEIKLTNQELIDRLDLPLDNNYSRTAMLGLMAAKEAIHSANITNIDDGRTGLISATSVGGMDMTEQYYYDYLSKEAPRKYIEGHHGGDSTQKIAADLGIRDFVTTISTACSSSANAIMLGARLINAGKVDRIVVGGTDCLSKFTINGFNTLMILSDAVCLPFDKNRKGLNLGEAAAYLVLESEEMVKRDAKKPLAYLCGWANANDAFHQTASSEEGIGATLAMQHALSVAKLAPDQIDYINAHGTATPNNDLSESRAIINVFGANVPMVSSTKAYTGHTLAAAAAIEAVFSVLSLQNEEVYPNLNFKTAIPETGIKPITKLKQTKVDKVLSNSFGFGGNCSTLIFSKH